MSACIVVCLVSAPFPFRAICSSFLTAWATLPKFESKEPRERMPLSSRQPINIKEGEGGVYENAPHQRDDVVRASDHQVLNPQEEVGQWASEAKMRFMEDANRLAGSITRDGKRVSCTHPCAVFVFVLSGSRMMW